ncbi:MAG: UbiX family flavin prenyltransferase [Thermoplasmata archaeon]|nr:UbiX family flavin prenyltransferase [Thermoplasmata archaeon]
MNRTLTDEGPYVIGVTGASGAAIAARVIETLRAAGQEHAVILSAGAAAVIQEELSMDPAEFLRGSTTLSDTDLGAPIASGSRRTRGMAVVPCSTNTLAKIALGLADTLITRAAHVHLKEHRRLVLVPRETPLSAIELGQMTRLAELGVVMLIASPPYYLHPTGVGDLVDYLAGKVLDHLGVPHHLYRGWRADGSSH